MAEVEKNHIRTNKQKEQKLLNIFYEENFRKKDKALFEQFIISKVNLATNDTIENADIAGAKDYVSQLAEKKTASVTRHIINIKSNQPGFNLLFYTGANYYDNSNPQFGRKDDLTRKAMKHQISKVNKQGGTHLIISDVFGWEWEIKYLRNAVIKDDKIYYFGINSRKERAVRDIKAYMILAQRAGLKDFHIYLMRGAQEHKIQKELGRDVFQEIYDELSFNNLHYIDEGVSLGMNVIKKGQSTKYGILGIQTNQTGKASTIQGANRSAYKDNGELFANVIFRCNSNVVGKLVGNEIYNVSNQSSFYRTPKGKKPELSTKFYDVFWLNLENDYEFSVVEGGTNIFDDNLALERKLHENCIKKQVLLKCCLQTIQNGLSGDYGEMEDIKYGK